MHKNIFSNHIAIFTIAVLLGAGLSTGKQVYAHDFTYTVPGNMCNPANLTQAVTFGMSWDQFRTFNPSATDSFFVTCGVPRSSGNNSALSNGYITAHFDTGYNAATPVSCIWRDIAFDVDGDNIGSTAVAVVQTITADGPLPDARFEFVDITTTFDEESPDRFWTVTCNLPPKTGINMIGVIGLTP